MDMKQMLQLMESTQEQNEQMPDILDQSAYENLIMGELLQYAPDYLDKHGEDTVRAAVNKVAAVHAGEPLEGSISTLVRQVMNYVGRNEPVEETPQEMRAGAEYADSTYDIDKASLEDLMAEYRHLHHKHQGKTEIKKIEPDYSRMVALRKVIRQKMKNESVNFAGSLHRYIMEQADPVEKLQQMYESALSECGDMAEDTEAHVQPTSQVSYSRTENVGDAQVTVSASAQTDAELDEILALAGISRTATVDAEAEVVVDLAPEEVVIQSPELGDEFQDIDDQLPRW